VNMKTIKIFQWREIGETDWERCYTPEAFAYYEKSPEHDTRIIYH
jgi:hypothetical protein